MKAHSANFSDISTKESSNPNEDSSNSNPIDVVYFGDGENSHNIEPSQLEITKHFNNSSHAMSVMKKLRLDNKSSALRFHKFIRPHLAGDATIKEEESPSTPPRKSYQPLSTNQKIDQLAEALENINLEEEFLDARGFYNYELRRKIPIPAKPVQQPKKLKKSKSENNLCHQSSQKPILETIKETDQEQSTKAVKKKVLIKLTKPTKEINASTQTENIAGTTLLTNTSQTAAANPLSEINRPSNLYPKTGLLYQAATSVTSQITDLISMEPPKINHLKLRLEATLGKSQTYSLKNTENLFANVLHTKGKRKEKGKDQNHDENFGSKKKEPEIYTKLSNSVLSRIQTPFEPEFCALRHKKIHS